MNIAVRIVYTNSTKMRKQELTYLVIRVKLITLSGLEDKIKEGDKV
jgi:hypothetical protein